MIFRLFLLGSAALVLGVPAVAQDAAVESRVGKLEKEMRAVQRQVFPNGAGKFLEPEIQSPMPPRRPPPHRPRPLICWHAWTHWKRSWRR